MSVKPPLEGINKEETKEKKKGKPTRERVKTRGLNQIEVRIGS